MPANFEVREHIASRLTAIQTRNNFDPNQGVEQLLSARRHLPQTQVCRIDQDWGAFQEMLRIAVSLDPPLVVPFDPLGSDPTKHAELRVQVKQKVYLIQKTGTNIFKIGRSWAPYSRRKSLNTGNESDLEIHAEIEVENPVRIERNVKRYTRRFKTRVGNETEWRTLSPLFVQDLVRDLRNGETFEGMPPA
jgi:hypothetical protein